MMEVRKNEGGRGEMKPRKKAQIKFTNQKALPLGLSNTSAERPVREQGQNIDMCKMTNKMPHLNILN